MIGDLGIHRVHNTQNQVYSRITILCTCCSIPIVKIVLICSMKTGVVRVDVVLSDLGLVCMVVFMKLFLLNLFGFADMVYLQISKHEIKQF